MGADRDRGGRAPGRRIVYCLVPAGLASKLHEPLRRHFREDPGVEVIVERRAGDRRSGGDRRSRAPSEEPPPVERRRVRSSEGRRVGERRAALVAAEAPALPRRARPYAGVVRFVERVEPSTQQSEDLDSARLVARFQAGEREVFSALYMRYFDRVYGYFHLVFRGDPHGAEDATQQVFTQALAALPRYERRGGKPFRAWLFMIARNFAIGVLRKSGQLEVVDPAQLAAVRDRPEPEELRAVDWLTERELVMLVERLPLAQRQVLVLRYMVGLSNAEVASVLDRSPEAVRMLHSRALSFLRDRLRALGRAPERHGRARVLGRVPQARIVRTRRFALLRPGPTA